GQGDDSRRVPGFPARQRKDRDAGDGAGGRAAPRGPDLVPPRRGDVRLHDGREHREGHEPAPRPPGGPVHRRREATLPLRDRGGRRLALGRRPRPAPLGDPPGRALHGRGPGRGVRPPQRRPRRASRPGDADEGARPEEHRRL
ncbi:MAG: hypothetical protein AVDCRST_MAG12-2140, partial [uncultured Rubrobacteraceae bacterium]